MPHHAPDASLLSDLEQARLLPLGPFLADMTRIMLADAGIGPGMRVLDVGCKTGELSFLAAAAVGPTGSVVGVDRLAPAIEAARLRARSHPEANVTFVTGDPRHLQLELDADFDAVIGRFTLMFVSEPAEVTARLTSLVQPGGIVAFQEWTAGDAFLSAPYCPHWHGVTDVLTETLRHAGLRLNLGLGLHRVFLDAGLPAPALRAERPTVADLRPPPDNVPSPALGYLGALLRCLQPTIERLGIADGTELAGLDDLPGRLGQEAASRRAVLAFPTLVSAWSSRP